MFLSASQATMKALGCRLTRSLTSSVKANPAVQKSARERSLHSSTQCSTDGVYQELTAMRVKTPFIEALRKQQENMVYPTENSSIQSTSMDRDLSPKKMSESHHKVVRALPRDIVTHQIG